MNKDLDDKFKDHHKVYTIVNISGDVLGHSFKFYPPEVNKFHKVYTSFESAKDKLLELGSGYLIRKHILVVYDTFEYTASEIITLTRQRKIGKILKDLDN